MTNPADEKRRALDDLERLLDTPEGLQFETPWKLIREQLRRGLNTRALVGLRHRIEKAIRNKSEPDF